MLKMRKRSTMRMTKGRMKMIKMLTKEVEGDDEEDGEVKTKSTMMKRKRGPLLT